MPRAPTIERPRPADVELRPMRREPPRPSAPAPPAPPVACATCGADAFAIGAAHEAHDGVDVELRCGACGHWQRPHLTAAAADRFLEHMAATQATIARALSSQR
jgi:hypothetical protein